MKAQGRARFFCEFIDERTVENMAIAKGIAFKVSHWADA